MRRLATSASVLALTALGLSLSATGASAATHSHALISGSGSSWSANAVNQWIADVQSDGLQVVFTSSGSAQGRKDFANKQNDFAVTDIGYQGHDPVTHTDDSSDGRAYAYLPIVAGGTSFPYQIKVAGKMVTNLRLSGLTLAKIFTGKITNWDDPEITKDNNGHALPSLQVIPVVHSEGSGSSAQFTRYLATEYSSLWTPFNSGRDELTEYYPQSHDGQVPQNGSDGVMNFVSSAAANGAIGYDEYSYALGKGYPVAKVENSAGYFTLPTQYNVAVALTKAEINYNKSSPDYLLENLDKVYVDSDKRTYPLSSYSYQIIPTAANDKTMTTAKRQTLADFDYYSICAGQKETGPIGYSPLPVNLVEAGFQQIAKLHSADPKVDLTSENVKSCANPTFVAGNPSANHLAQIAPYPLACDRAGAGPCTAAGAPGAPAKVGNGGAPNPVQSTQTTAPTTKTGGSKTHTAAPKNPKVAATTGPAVVDPATEQAGAAGAAAATTTTDVVAQPAQIAESQDLTILGVLAAILLVAILIVPPFVASRLRARRDTA